MGTSRSDGDVGGEPAGRARRVNRLIGLSLALGNLAAILAGGAVGGCLMVAVGCCCSLLGFALMRDRGALADAEFEGYRSFWRLSKDRMSAGARRQVMLPWGFALLALGVFEVVMGAGSIAGVLTVGLG